MKNLKKLTLKSITLHVFFYAYILICKVQFLDKCSEVTTQYFPLKCNRVEIKIGMKKKDSSKAQILKSVLTPPT